MFPWKRSPLVAPLVLLLAVCALPARAQESVRVITPPPEPGDEIREDGTWVLRGDSLPDHLIYQNLLLVLHVDRLDDVAWEGVLDQMGIEPESGAAAALGEAASEAFPIIQDEISRGDGLEGWRRLGTIWRQLTRKLDQEGVLDNVLDYAESEIRVGASLMVSPDSQPDYHFNQRRRQEAFEGEKQ